MDDGQSPGTGHNHGEIKTQFGATWPDSWPAEFWTDRPGKRDGKVRAFFSLILKDGP